MKLALIGYGKMGKMVEQIALERGHTLVACLNSQNQDFDAIAQADLCIEFTEPKSVINNLKKIASYKKNIVIGTTGWKEHSFCLKKFASEHNLGVLYAANFSLGLNLFKLTLSYLSQHINSLPAFDIAGIEEHHRHKRDSPSGTALSLSKAVEKNVSRLTKLPWSSIRCGEIPGTHTVLFDSALETITLKHSVRDRKIFADGAMNCAEWLIGKKGFFTFEDYLNDITGKL